MLKKGYPPYNFYMKTSKLKEKIAHGLDLPLEVSGSYKILITPNHIEIENYMGIMDYEDGFLKIKLGEKIVSIDGKALEIQEMTDDNIQIKGSIQHLAFSI